MITAGYMSEEESEEYQGKVHFVVHSPDFRSTGMFFGGSFTPIAYAYMLLLSITHSA